jgi:hypothetical protein
MYDKNAAPRDWIGGFVLIPWARAIAARVSAKPRLSG